MSSKGTINLTPIGFVKTEAIGKKVRDKSLISKIVFREELTEALEGIQDFSHLFVIFWLHKMEEREKATMKIHPRGMKDLPLLGVFATRTPCRPNPLGLTRVKLLGVKGNIVTVQGLDAFDGTPVLDIKPFDFWDRTEEATVPGWWMKLEKEMMERKKENR
jgi:tRNA-Thr(GGU) m(6)t(6)A37 methyltransferase TsaA